MIFAPVLLIWLIVPFANAKRIFFGEEGVAFYTCATYIQEAAHFCLGELATIPYACLCANSNAMATMTGCFDDIEESNSKSYGYYSYFCNYYFNADVTTKNVEEAYQLYQLTAQNYTVYDLLNISTTPLKFPQESFSQLMLLKESFEESLGDVDYSWYFGIGCLAYWALMVVVSAIVNWGAFLFPGLRKTFNGVVTKLIRRFITLPALAGLKRNVPQPFLYVFDFSVPSRLETIVIFCFFWLLFALNVVHIKYVDHDPAYVSKSMAIASLVSNRTCLLAMILTPLVFLLESRNNVLIWVTRWKRSTLLLFARWIGRMVVLLVFVHMVCLTSMYRLEHSYTDAIEGSAMAWGVLAIVCGFLMWVTGIFFVRRNAYEFKAAIRIPLAIFWLVGMWFNTSSLGIEQIIYPSFAVWGFDTLVRVIRIVSFGFRSAQVSLLADDTLKIEIAKPKFWCSAPGRHAYVHFLNGLHFFQNHPFMYYESVSDNSIVMKCKVHSGITKSLAKKLEATPEKKMTIRVAVDGPYGFSSPVHHNSTVFVAGGSAIAGVYSEAVALTKKSSDSSRSIKLVWAVSSFDSVAGFEKELLALSATQVAVTVHVAEGAKVEHIATENDEETKSIADNSSGSGSSQVSFLQSNLPNVEFVEERPDLQNLVQQEVSEAAASVAFVTSGPAKMCDEMRKHVVQQIGQTEKRVDFYDKMQVWA